jgi:hypothetical protein
MARFEAMRADGEFPDAVFGQVADGKRLEQIAKELRLPRGAFVEWYSTVHAKKLDAALKVVALRLAFDALDAAEGAPRQAVNPSGAPLFDQAGKPVLEEKDVGRDKLRSDVMMKLASRLDRQRLGERATLEVEVEDNRSSTDRETMLLETARSLAFVMARGADIAAARAGVPKLEIKREEKIVDGSTGSTEIVI